MSEGGDLNEGSSSGGETRTNSKYILVIELIGRGDSMAVGRRERQE